MSSDPRGREHVSTPGRSGVVFDLDATRVDSDYLRTQAWVRARRACGEWVASNAVHRLVGALVAQL